MDARCDRDVRSIAAGVELLTELPSPRRKASLRIGKDELIVSGTRDVSECCRQHAAENLPESRIAFRPVNVYRNKPADRPGRNPDVGVGVRCPPRADLIRISGSVVEAIATLFL